MSWQQIFVIVLLSMDAGMALIKDGQPKEGKWSFWLTLISDGILAAVLLTGGFWK